MKNKFIIILLILTMLVPFTMPKRIAYALDTDYNCKAYVLLEPTSKTIIKSNNANDRLPIASVTKLMTILLTLEKIDAGEIALDDMVTVSENANGMGGSQIFLDANTEYKLSDLLKSVIVASANDSSVALAEYISGSERNFVEKMNNRAKELNMLNTYYSNCTGLPTNDAYSCAYDQALLLNEVLNFDTYREMSHIWLEDFVHPSGRITQMTNTNKLIRSYNDCLGGKTGSTNQAKYCLAVGAEKNDTRFISVILGSNDSKERFKSASELLNYGFSNYSSVKLLSNNDLEAINISIKGTDKFASIKLEREYSTICDKNAKPNYSLEYNVPTMLKSVKENEIIGNVDVVLDGKVVDTIDIISTSTIDEPTIWDYVLDLIG